MNRKTYRRDSPLLIPQCSSLSPVDFPSRLIEMTFDISCSCRAPSFASVRTATPESSVRSLTRATADLVTTTAPAATSGRGVKDATSHAHALQVCVCPCVHRNSELLGSHRDYVVVVVYM